MTLLHEDAERRRIFSSLLKNDTVQVGLWAFLTGLILGLAILLH